MTRLDDETRYPAGSIGAMLPDVAAVMEGLLRERNALESQVVRLRATIEAVAEALAGDDQAVLRVAEAQQVLIDADRQEQP